MSMMPELTRQALSSHAHALQLDIGDHSYGTPNLRYDLVDFAPRRLAIGRYCSIGEKVEIFIGRHGRHGIDSLTTYPLTMAVSPDVKQAVDAEYPPVPEHWQAHLNRPLDVAIGHDVWIGLGVTIMGGVRIGDGAVIGAQAVVTRDVAPFAVVGGSPAREIKMRHRPDIARRLQDLQWWLREPDDLYRALGGLLHSTDMEQVLRRLERHDAQAAATPREKTD